MTRITLIFSTYGQANQPFLVSFFKLLKSSNRLEIVAFANKINKNEEGVTSYVPANSVFKAYHFFHHYIQQLFKTKLPPKPLPKLRNMQGICHVLNAQQFEKVLVQLPQKTAIVCSFRGYETEVRPLEDNAWKAALSSIYASANRLHFVSDYLKNRAIKLGAPEEKCIRIYRSVDLDFFTPIKRNNRNSYNIISVGRLTWQKGFKHGIKAMAILKDQGVDFSYTIYGDDEEQKNLEELIARYKLADCVIIKNHVDHEALKKYYQQADVLLVPSETDALPNVILEASAMELPIVATNVGGIIEAVRDGETGILVESKNAEEIAAALQNLWQKQEKRIEMGKKARAFVASKFHPNVILSQWEHFYQSIQA